MIKRCGTVVAKQEFNPRGSCSRQQCHQQVQLAPCITVAALANGRVQTMDCTLVRGNEMKETWNEQVVRLDYFDSDTFCLL